MGAGVLHRQAERPAHPQGQPDPRRQDPGPGPVAGRVALPDDRHRVRHPAGLQHRRGHLRRRQRRGHHEHPVLGGPDRQPAGAGLLPGGPAGGGLQLRGPQAGAGPESLYHHAGRLGGHHHGGGGRGGDRAPDVPGAVLQRRRPDRPGHRPPAHLHDGLVLHGRAAGLPADLPGPGRGQDQHVRGPAAQGDPAAAPVHHHPAGVRRHGAQPAGGPLCGRAGQRHHLGDHLHHPVLCHRLEETEIHYLKEALCWSNISLSFSSPWSRSSSCGGPSPSGWGWGWMSCPPTSWPWWATWCRCR